ncbi:uncharacterized protein [Haliotis asinina]|uniref:uncharacterized protein n=1 Tax=Haliotis asinina TaxID=109174 RepID=UPI0035320C31
MFRKICLTVLTCFRPAEFTQRRFHSLFLPRNMPIRVAVIGAGAGGLCAMRHLLARPDVFDGVCFEQCPIVGGTWVYTDRVGTDEYGLPVHSSMYKNLRTNLPKEVMAFPDFPFKDNLPSFVFHQEVLQYLQDYSDHFNVTDKIKFQTRVDSVRPLKSNNSEPKWEVQYCNVFSQTKKQTELFDAVIVCNGHYSIPLVPDIPGLDKFKGRVLHSHDYREPDAFKQKRVVCLGAQSSGMDIMVELSTVAQTVFISHNKAPLTSKLPSNVEQKPGIVRFTEDSVIFSNEDEQKIDSVVFCTGYKYTFPFLSESCNLKIENERVTPLYKHLIHTEFPTLSFIGICKVVCPFPQFHFQVLVALSVLDGSLKLPSQNDMNQDIEKDYQHRLSQGLLPRYAHHMGPRQWAYNDELADMAQCPRLDQQVMELYNTVHEWRARDAATYKKMNVTLEKA